MRVTSLVVVVAPRTGKIVKNGLRRKFVFRFSQSSEIALQI